MLINSQNFIASSQEALNNPNLQTALARASSGFIDKRIKAINSISNFEQLKEQGSKIKQHSLDNLGYYLQQFEEMAIASGAQVHWAKDGTELNDLVLHISKSKQAKIVTKGKSMVSEETDLRVALESTGVEVVETDLGEYIIQLANEKPSHIVAPAVHKTRSEITDLFKHHHIQYGLDSKRDLSEPQQLVAEARSILRSKYVESDIGITGANFLIAENGGMMLITNEGNGDLSSVLPPIHIVTVGIEKVVPRLNDAFLLMRLLTNSATGQSVTCYTSLLNGAKKTSNSEEESDAPLERHFILLDNGRSKIYNSKYREILKCIRCGACLNHCPVYGAIGGNAYGSVYPGPLGAVLTPLLADPHKVRHLPNASSLCGRCVEVCPVKIPLTTMLRDLRTEQINIARVFNPWGLVVKIFMKLALSPKLYHILIYFIKKIMRLLLLTAAKKY